MSEKIITAFYWIEAYLMREKAQRVFDKCIQAKKFMLANKIARKYNVDFRDRWDDTVVSLGIAMMAARKKHYEK
jgi:hypothetical protein